MKMEKENPMNIFKKRLRLPRMSLSISQKLILSYLALAAIIATAGGSGWIAINSIGENVKILAEVTAPIQEEASAVTRNVERSQNTALEVLTHTGPAEIEECRARLEDLGVQFAESIVKMKTLSASSDRDLSLEAATESYGLFKDEASAIFEAHARSLESESKTDEKAGELDQHITAHLTILGELRSVAEARMNETEENVKTKILTGDATTEELGEMIEEMFSETYPLVQNTSKLVNYIIKLHESARAHTSGTDLDQIESHEKVFAKWTETYLSRQKRLARRARSPNTKDLFENSAATDSGRSLPNSRAGGCAKDLHRRPRKRQSLRSNQAAWT
jgi:hypothetical protein